jgi:hypothetical protein
LTFNGSGVGKENREKEARSGRRAGEEDKEKASCSGSRANKEVKEKSTHHACRRAGKWSVVRSTHGGGSGAGNKDRAKGVCGCSRAGKEDERRHLAVAVEPARGERRSHGVLAGEQASGQG